MLDRGQKDLQLLGLRADTLRTKVGVASDRSVNENHYQLLCTTLRMMSTKSEVTMKFCLYCGSKFENKKRKIKGQ